MSRQLPKRPNLEYLKKQAKERLAEVLQQDPSAQLADAQHALAREYGFESWPKLHAHVEAATATIVEPPRPFAGTWEADIARSSRHPANLFQRATIIIEVRGDEVRLTDIVVDESGRRDRTVNTIRVDGREYASPAGNGYSLLARWRDSRALEAVAWKDGQIVGTTTYTVSTDGRTLTITADQQSIVLARMPSA